VTEAEYNAVLAEFPKGTNQTLDGILFHARYKPETTYGEYPRLLGLLLRRLTCVQIPSCSRSERCLSRATRH
jgi:hypothetical protein